MDIVLFELLPRNLTGELRNTTINLCQDSQSRDDVSSRYLPSTKQECSPPQLSDGHFAIECRYMCDVHKCIYIYVNIV
jgi:hypothetical protein